MNRAALLHDAQSGHRVMLDLWRHIKPHLMAGHRLIITVKPETRSSAQNALLHAALQEIADQLPWVGSLRDVDTWKRLLMAAWLRARSEGVEELPAIDGRGVDIVFRRTSTLSRAQCSEFQEYVYSWGAQQGVHFSSPKQDQK